MGKHWYYFFFMLWFSYLIVSSVLLFARGFLLSKNARMVNSTCLSFNEIPCKDSVSPVVNSIEESCSNDLKLVDVLQNVNGGNNVCLMPKARVILVIIDALRHDMALFDEELRSPLPYQNKLPIINKLRNENPEFSRLYKFMADPPTTTMQRLKAMTTGSLPTFIDAGSNFATNEINEDNLIDQLLRNNQSIVLIGDDTWDGLYPNRFLRKYPFPSFDVWDLDTVDNGVIEHLYPELKKSDWNFLIAHFLGVDHCGHRYGPDHAEMDRKLTEMNHVIKNIAAELDENTMLFVIGDHGMTETGNHGGDSEDELSAALFVYSKQPLTLLQNSVDTVRQVGIVPTLAQILGVSIPFSNLGTIILDALPITNHSSLEEWRFSLFYLWSNVQQVFTYIEDYSQTSAETFSLETLSDIRFRFASLKSKINAINSESSFEQFAKECDELITYLRIQCEQVWIEFDSFSITRGLVFLFLALCFVYMVVDGVPADKLPESFMGLYIACVYIALLLATILAVILYYLNFVTSLLLTIYFLTGFVSVIMLVLLVIQNWEVISLTWYDRSQKERIPNLVCRLVLVFHICGLFSNSFVVEEASVLLFLLTTIILIGSFSVTGKKKRDYKSKLKLLFVAFGVLLLVRISVYYWRCRDRLEQPWCYSENTSSFTTKLETTKIQWLITVISLGLFVTATKVWLRNCGNLNGFSVTVTLMRYVPTVLVVCMSGYWVLNRLPVGSNKRQWQTNALAWMVYGLSALGIGALILKPLCVYILPGRRDVPVEDNQINVPSLFRMVKRLFDSSAREDVPVVCGLGTAYSAVFVGIAVYLTQLFALLHGDAVAPATIIMFLTAAFLLIIISVIRLEKATCIDDLFELSNMSVLVWTILCQYFFYGTSHQPSFPNIIWEAAFVGTSGVFQYNFVPASLIIINTFCSQILMGLLVPLLIIAPFTISMMFPNDVKRNIFQNDNTRGEMLLYERSGLMTTVVFSTICKYMIFHGVRVFATMLAATIHCRHMMIWKIFAPKFIFESIGLFVTLASVNISFLILVRIHDQINNLIVTLNKRYS